MVVVEGKPRRAKPVAACPFTDQSGSAFLACSRALMRFLATAVLCMKLWDSLPVSTATFAYFKSGKVESCLLDRPKNANFVGLEVRKS